MVDSRLRANPPNIFHCFVQVSAPREGQIAIVDTKYPEIFEEQESILKGLAAFCFPCTIYYDGVQYSTFVLTDLDSKFRFGFCRYPPYAKHCLCIVSYFPWFHTFYGVLDKVAQLLKNDEDNFNGVEQFLEALNEQPIPAPGSKLYFHFSDDHKTQSFKVTVPDTGRLPIIPDDRNLTEYFAKVTPENMVNLFISMLFERRIIIFSEKLSVLTAVIHGSVSLLYPMQWQHIYIPILPVHLLDYCCAPMPFLLGVHSSMMDKVKRMPLSEVVLFDADANEMAMIEEDVEVFPDKISSKLKRKLKHLDRALDDYVSRQFLNSLADIMGGYREALKFIETKEGEKIVFDDEMFLNSRTGSIRLFLESILNLQSFRQFIAGRLEMLNDEQALDDMFEKTINQRSLDAASETKYFYLKDKMRKGGGAIKKGGAAFKKTVDGSYSQLKGMAHDIDAKDIKKKFKEKYKDVKEAMVGVQKEHNGEGKDYKRIKVQSTSCLLDNSQSSNILPKSSKPLPPPRPPRPSSEFFCKHVESNSLSDSNNSGNDISTLINFSPVQPADLDLYFSLRLNEGIENPCFYGNQMSNNTFINLQSAWPADEDITFEHTPISIRDKNEIVDNAKNYLARSSSFNSTTSKVIDNQKNFYNPLTISTSINGKDSNSSKERVSSISRKKPVSGKKPVVPPRPSPGLAPLKKTAEKPEIPERPNVITLYKNASTENDNRDLICESDPSKFSPSEPFRMFPIRSELNKSNPFFAPSISPPSSDLLHLEQSLFHETMNSVSNDTRTLLLSDTNTITSELPSTSTSRITTSIIDYTHPVKISNILPNYNINEFRLSPRPPEIKHKFEYQQSEKRSGPGATDDLFVSCLEDAKAMKYAQR